MKKKIFILIGFVLIIAIVIYAIYFVKGTSHETVEQDKTLKSTLMLAVSSSKEINFDTMIDLDWDEMYVITPYKNPKEFFEKTNGNWKEIDQSIEVKDDINLVIFLKEKNIVCYFNYPRANGDFVFSGDGVFSRDSTNFTVINEGNEIKLILQ